MVIIFTYETLDKGVYKPLEITSQCIVLISLISTLETHVRNFAISYHELNKGLLSSYCLSLKTDFVPERVLHALEDELQKTN